MISACQSNFCTIFRIKFGFAPLNNCTLCDKSYKSQPLSVKLGQFICLFVQNPKIRRCPTIHCVKNRTKCADRIKTRNNCLNFIANFIQRLFQPYRCGWTYDASYIGIAYLYAFALIGIIAITKVIPTKLSRNPASCSWTSGFLYSLMIGQMLSFPVDPDLLGNVFPQLWAHLGQIT